jgi:hypothetical protein
MFNDINSGRVSIQLKELRGKCHSPYKINFGLGEEKRRSVGKIQLVTIQNHFITRLGALDLNMQA